MPTIEERLRAIIAEAQAILDDINHETWADIIYAQIGEEPVTNQELTRRVKRHFREIGRPWYPNAPMTINATLQFHCATCPAFAGRRDLFRQVRRGVWQRKPNRRLRVA